MVDAENVRIVVSPTITADQLFAFYQKNDICEKGFGKATAAKVLQHSSLIVGAFEGERLVGLARAMFDGLSADIVDFCLDLEYQGAESVYANGSIIEHDSRGVGKAMAEALIGELLNMGATFISTRAIANVEEWFWASLGFRLNEGSRDYIH